MDEMDLKSEIYKSPRKAVSNVNQFDYSSDMKDFNNDDTDDIIDLSNVNFPNDDMWLFSCSSKSTNDDNICDWLHQDFNQLKDVEYQTQHLLILRELNRLNDLESETLDKNAFINSRTFTRPKKRLARPVIEEFTFGQPYQKNSSDIPNEQLIPDFNESNSTSDISARINKLKSKLLLVNSNDNVSNVTNISKKGNEIQSKQTQIEVPSYINGISSISEERPLVSDNGDVPLKAFKNPFDPKFNDALHNTATPCLINSFTLPSESSINESEFITAMTQPEDLFMSFTSVAASDTSEDQNTFITYSESDNFAENIKELNETFSKSFHFPDDNNEDLNATFVTTDIDNHVENNVDLAEVNKTYTTPPNYFATFKKKPQFINSGPESITFTSVSDNNPNFKTFRKLKGTSLNKTIDCNGTINIESDIPNIDPNQTITKSEQLINNLNNTFVALPDTQKISSSDPNLLDNSLEYLNTTFDKTKQVAGSAESLDISSSVSDCSSNSYRVLNMEQVDQMARMQEKSLILGSTPKSKMTKKIWGSSDTFSTTSLNISNISGETDGNRRFSPASSTHSSPTKGSLKDIYKASKMTSPKNMRLPSKPQVPTERAVPTMIVKPMEPPSRPPVPTEVSTFKEPNPSVAPVKRSQLRQPMFRASGLPRPTNSTSALSSIPRPQSRIPGPSQLRKPSSRPSSSSDRLDGCY